MKTQWKFRAAAMAAIILAFLVVQPSFAQNRMSDHDIENVMKNLKQDSKTFQSAFNSSIGKSTIRKTSQEKDAKATVQLFRNQTDRMLDVFQDKHKADQTLPSVLSTSQQIDEIFKNVQLGGSAKSTWDKCKSELAILGTQFNMSGY
ncbi:MAG: hypothetical protein WA823_01935 [Candidatus Acidiferrales bacterium]